MQLLSIVYSTLSLSALVHTLKNTHTHACTHACKHAQDATNNSGTISFFHRKSFDQRAAGWQQQRLLQPDKQHKLPTRQLDSGLGEIMALSLVMHQAPKPRLQQQQQEAECSQSQ